MNKNLKSILIALLVLIGCIGLFKNLDLDNLKDNSTNTSQNTNNNEYLMTGELFYQKHNDLDKVRFLMMFGGLNEELYNEIDDIKFNIYDYQTNELVNSSNSSDVGVYTSVLENGTKVQASDYGYDYICTYVVNLTFNKQYKVIVEFYNSYGMFYRFTQGLTLKGE